jgi:hypothetical protein
MILKMAHTLQLDEMLITESLLAQRHQQEGEVHLHAKAIVTPSARDYLRMHGVVLIQGASGSSTIGSAARSSSPGAATSSPTTGTPIQEILPPGSESGLLYHGRCDHPDRAFGCQTEEFGSGYVEPACCDECARNGKNGGSACSCEQCAGDDEELEFLVQRLTDEIMSRLEQ